MKNPQVVAFDFDETIGLYKPSDNGKGYQVKMVDNVPNPKVVKLMRNLIKSGVRVVVYSSRWWGDYNALKKWLKKHKVPVSKDGVILGRFKADAYICDKSLNPHHKGFEKQLTGLLKNHHSWGMHYESRQKTSRI